MESQPDQKKMYNKKIFIPGEPKAQKRHRSVRIGNGIRNYDPSASDKGDFLSQIRSQRPHEPLMGAIRVDITFFFSRPKSHYGTGKNADQLKPNAPYYHTSKPDRDNLDKLCLDAMSKIFWHDDSQVCDGRLLKVYTVIPNIQPGILIEITELFNEF